MPLYWSYKNFSWSFQKKKTLMVSSWLFTLFSKIRKRFSQRQNVATERISFILSRTPNYRKQISNKEEDIQFHKLFIILFLDIIFAILQRLSTIKALTDEHIFFHKYLCDKRFVTNTRVYEQQNFVRQIFHTIIFWPSVGINNFLATNIVACDIWIIL